jgi:hypothetical protein
MSVTQKEQIFSCSLDQKTYECLFVMFFAVILNDRWQSKDRCEQGNATK